MGGSSKNTTPASPAAATTPTQPMQTIQPAMPGQLEALAQQLGAGFGQPAPDMLAYIQQFHRPMQVPDYSPQPAATPTPVASTPTPAQAAAGQGQPNADQIRQIFASRSRGGGS